MSTYILVILGSVILLVGIFAIAYFTTRCRPFCDGVNCGQNDGCGKTCQCQEGGQCKNGQCYYSQCDGIFCGTDKYGNQCKCDALPNGTCTNNKCCYARICDGVFCGPDGCGGTCQCQTGASCHIVPGQTGPHGESVGICVSSGEPGWSFNITDDNGQVKTAVSSAQECAQWFPPNVYPNETKFPCTTIEDCPDGYDCRQGFCNRGDVWQYWVYDSQSPGENCTKIRQGSTVCGVQNTSATSFDVIGNVGPSSETCSSCTISPAGPPSGVGAICPADWRVRQSNSSKCADSSGEIKCCLNIPGTVDYRECLQSHPDCTQIQSWYRGGIAQVSSKCDSSVKGPDVPIPNLSSIPQPFYDACQNKKIADTCSYNDGATTFDGTCRSCTSGGMVCQPTKSCLAATINSNQPGICSENNWCS